MKKANRVDRIKNYMQKGQSEMQNKVYFKKQQFSTCGTRSNKAENHCFEASRKYVIIIYYMTTIQFYILYS